MPSGTFTGVKPPGLQRNRPRATAGAREGIWPKTQRPDFRHFSIM